MAGCWAHGYAIHFHVHARDFEERLRGNHPDVGRNDRGSGEVVFTKKQKHAYSASDSSSLPST